MPNYPDYPDLTPEEWEEYEQEQEEAGLDPDDPDYEFFNDGQELFSMGQSMYPGGMFIPIMPSIGFMPKRPILNDKNPGHLKPIHQYPSYYLFNREYVLRVLDAIYVPFDDDHPEDDLTISMEIEATPDFRGKRKFRSLMDLQEYLESSHLINFIIACNTSSGGAWNLNNIKYNILATEKYSKILILAQGLSKYPPEWVDAALNDHTYHESRTVNMCMSMDEPAQVIVHRKNHLYHPLVVYDISVGFNGSTGVNTNSEAFNPTVLFEHVIKPQLADAKDLFFSPSNPIHQYTESHDSSIRCQFKMASYGGLVRVKMLCSPAVISYCVDAHTIDVIEYGYEGGIKHISGSEPLQTIHLDNPLPSFIDCGMATSIAAYASSADSQIIPLITTDNGFINRGDRVYDMNQEYQSMILIDRYVDTNELSDRWSDHDSELYKTLRTPDVSPHRCHIMSRFKSKGEHAQQYLGLVAGAEPIKMLMDKSVTPGYEVGMTIYGFIEFGTNGSNNLTLREVLDFLIKDEHLMEVLHLPKVFEKIVHKNLFGTKGFPDFRFLEVYHSAEISRLAIIECWRTEI